MLRAEKAAKAGGREALERKALLERVQAHLDTGAPVRTLALAATEREQLRELFLLTAKPVLYIANIAEDGFVDNPLLDQVRGIAEREGAEMVPVCAAIEAELAELEDADKAEFLADYGLSGTGAGSSDPRRLQAVWAGNPLPPAPRKYGPGPFELAPPRRRRRA